MSDICNECGQSVSPGSGRFVNRIPDLADVETRFEMGKPFPQGEWLCEECDIQIEIEYQIQFPYPGFPESGHI